jgi:hypothetical protein
LGGGSETVHVYSTGAIGCTEAGDHGEVLRYKKKRSKSFSAIKRLFLFESARPFFFILHFSILWHSHSPKKNKKVTKCLYTIWHALILQNHKMSMDHMLLNLSTCQADNVLGVS